MTSAYVLIAAVLLLGGAIAALGDRLGSKIGKARLRLFRLRPRQTAILVTILTGTTIAAVTLGILFALSESLRQGVFQLDRILNERRAARKELVRLAEEREEVAAELEAARAEREAARSDLQTTTQRFRDARRDLQAVSEEVAELAAERSALEADRDRLQAQIAERDEELAARAAELEESARALEESKARLAASEGRLRDSEAQLAASETRLRESETRLREIAAQRSTLQAEIQERDERIAALDRRIADRDRTLQMREARLQELEAQLGFLRGEVAELEQYYQYFQALRQGDVALVRGQVLSFNVVRLNDPRFGTEVANELLREANRTAIAATQPGVPEPREQIIRVSRAQVEQLLERISDGEDYVVQILAAGNYLRGEENIPVIVDVAPNERVFEAGEEVATVSADSDLEDLDVEGQLELLLATAQFQARRSGLLGRIRVGENDLGTIRFLEEVAVAEEPFEQFRAIAAETTYAAGPLTLELVALRDGRVELETSPDAAERSGDRPSRRLQEPDSPR